MPSANALRIQIENTLAHRIPGALTPVTRTIRETWPTGIPEVDKLLDGGLPVGAISEVTGPQSSGRTSLAISFLARCTEEGRVCAWVDADDTFDAESAAGSGVCLKQLLWVRCGGRGKLAKYARLDQAIRSTDLLLQAGGFAALVLDLGSTSLEQGLRIPLATWFRYRQATDRSRCSLLVLAQAPLAQSSAVVVLECAPHHARTRDEKVLSGYFYEVRSGRQRFTPGLTMARKPPASTWSATGAWENRA